MARRRQNRSYKKQTRTYPKRPNRRLRSITKYTDPNPFFVQSRRTYTPSYTHIQKQPRNTYTTVTTTQNSTPSYAPLPSRRKTLNYTKALICARRKQRKEILHALKHTGKAGQKRPHRNQHSQTKCTN